MYEGSNFSTFLSTLFIVFLFITSIIVVLIHHGVVLIFIFLVTNDVELFFMCLLAICMYIFSWEMSIKILFTFKGWLMYLFIAVVRVLYIFWKLVPYQKNDLQIFSSIPWVVFSLSGRCFEMWMLKILIKSNLLNFFSSCLRFSCLIWETTA